MLYEARHPIFNDDNIGISASYKSFLSAAIEAKYHQPCSRKAIVVAAALNNRPRISLMRARSGARHVAHFWQDDIEEI